VERLAEALRMQVWDDAFGPRTAHAAHHFHAYCAVCSGDTESIARALLPVVEQALAEARGEALREAADAIEPPGSDYYSPTAAWWLRERADAIATTEGAP
jgi:hypothetical protein